ncbi:MAG: hypothetical protein IPN90_08520 [Elusimicrobia bacterium]|nr:hypothetical protein [Elusimicrobiota bacterium]
MKKCSPVFLLMFLLGCANMRPAAPIGEKSQNWIFWEDSVLYHFSISFPENWDQSIHGVNLVLVPPDGKESVSVAGDADIEALEGGTTNCKNITLADNQAFDCPTGSFIGKRAIYFPTKKIIIYDNVEDAISNKIISTFRFINNKPIAQQGAQPDAGTGRKLTP